MIDSVDRSLIQLLQENARQSSEALAKRLGVSAASVRRRIGALIQKGIIRIVARPDPTKIGYAVRAIIALDLEHEELHAVLEALNSKPEILFLATTTGRFDAMAEIWTTSTDNLYKLIHDIAQIKGIRNIETFICLHTQKST